MATIAEKWEERGMQLGLEQGESQLKPGCEWRPLRKNWKVVVWCAVLSIADFR